MVKYLFCVRGVAFLSPACPLVQLWKKNASGVPGGPKTGPVFHFMLQPVQFSIRLISPLSVVHVANVCGGCRGVSALLQESGMKSKGESEENMLLCPGVQIFRIFALALATLIMATDLFPGMTNR